MLKSKTETINGIMLYRVIPEIVTANHVDPSSEIVHMENPLQSTSMPTVQTAQTVQTVQPVRAVKPVKSVQFVEEDKPVQTVHVDKPVQSTQTTQSTHANKPIQQTSDDSVPRSVTVASPKHTVDSGAINLSDVKQAIEVIQMVGSAVATGVSIISKVVDSSRQNTDRQTVGSAVATGVSIISSAVQKRDNSSSRQNTEKQNTNGMDADKMFKNRTKLPTSFERPPPAHRVDKPTQHRLVKPANIFTVQQKPL